MTDTEESSTGENTESESSEYIETDEVTLGLESDLLDVLITEDDLRSSPVITAEPNPISGFVTVHLPLPLKWIAEEETRDLPYSKNFVHTQMTPDRARELIDQLETAVEEVEGNDRKEVTEQED